MTAYQAYIKPDENFSLHAVNEFMREDMMLNLEPGKHYEITFKKVKTETIRTGLQNKAIHKYCGNLAIAFNEAGYDLMAVLEKFQAIVLEWTTEAVKECIWRRIQVALSLPVSTTKLTTDQVNKVYRNVDRFTSEKLGITLPFPSRFSQGLE